MFVSAHDALVVGAIAAFAVVIALRPSQLMGGGVMDDAERMRRELVAAVSHDLRTPITSLQLLIDAIADDVVDEATRRRYLGADEHPLDALSALIDDLFELSRLEAGEIAWSLERVAARRARRRDRRRDARAGRRARTSTVRAECRRACGPPAPTRRSSSACSST